MLLYIMLLFRSYPESDHTVAIVNGITRRHDIVRHEPIDLNCLARWDLSLIINWGETIF